MTNTTIKSTTIHQNDSTIIRWYRFSDGSEGIQCFNKVNGQMVSVADVDSESQVVYSALETMLDILHDKGMIVDCN